MGAVEVASHAAALADTDALPVGYELREQSPLGRTYDGGADAWRALHRVSRRHRRAPHQPPSFRTMSVASVTQSWLHRMRTLEAAASVRDRLYISCYLWGCCRGGCYRLARTLTCF